MAASRTEIEASFLSHFAVPNLYLFTIDARNGRVRRNPRFARHLGFTPDQTGPVAHDVLLTCLRRQRRRKESPVARRSRDVQPPGASSGPRAPLRNILSSSAGSTGLVR